MNKKIIKYLCRDDKILEVNYMYKFNLENNLSTLQAFEDDGSAVLETAVVITVLLAIALIFHSQISSFASSLFSKAFNEGAMPSY